MTLKLSTEGLFLCNYSFTHNLHKETIILEKQRQPMETLNYINQYKDLLEQTFLG